MRLFEGLDRTQNDKLCIFNNLQGKFLKQKFNKYIANDKKISYSVIVSQTDNLMFVV